ncbi:MAG: hypothetical protein V4677_06390 [Bacteroidota bacterium]
MKLFSIFSVLLSLLILVACTKDIGPNPDLVKTDFCDTISFDKHIKPIIEANCISCHTPGQIGNGDFDTDMYAGLKSKVDNNTLKGRAVDRTIFPNMPYSDPPYSLPPLSESDRKTLGCWIDAGAPNN